MSSEFDHEHSIEGEYDAHLPDVETEAGLCSEVAQLHGSQAGGPGSMTDEGFFLILKHGYQ